MAKVTKQELEQENQKLKTENLIMLWHIQDLHNNIKPSAEEQYETITGVLYRPTSGLGGYIVLKDSESNSITVTPLEETYRYYKNLSSIDSILPFQIITERLFVARNRILFSK